MATPPTNNPNQSWNEQMNALLAQSQNYANQIVEFKNQVKTIKDSHSTISEDQQAAINNRFAEIRNLIENTYRDIFIHTLNTPPELFSPFFQATLDSIAVAYSTVLNTVPIPTDPIAQARLESLKLKFSYIHSQTS